MIQSIQTFNAPELSRPLTATEWDKLRFDMDTKIRSSGYVDPANLIIDATCEFYGITQKELLVKLRTTKASHRRFMVYKLMDEAGMSCLDIGRAMSNDANRRNPREHSGILYGIRKISDLIGEGAKLKRPPKDRSGSYELKLAKAEFQRLRQVVTTKLEQLQQTNNNHNETT